MTLRTFQTARSRLMCQRLCLKCHASSLRLISNLQGSDGRAGIGTRHFDIFRSFKTSSSLGTTTQISTTDAGTGENGGDGGNSKQKDKEDTALSEIITIYERMTKSRSQETEGIIFRPSKHGAPNKADAHAHQVEEEMVSLVPTFEEIAQITKSQQELEDGTSGTTFNSAAANANLHDFQSVPDHHLLDFNKYRNVESKRYTFFSSATDLLQSNTLSSLSPDYVGLLKSKSYWLNILNPTEEDIHILHTSFNVHDLTLSDIRTPNSEEKIEIYKHYTFVSLKLMCESAEIHSHLAKPFDNDFNILLFKDFVITLHNTDWAGIKDILGFLNLLCARTKSPLEPHWILFSALTELKQDARFLFDKMEPEINQVRIASKTMLELSGIMKQIFDMEFEIYMLNRFIKPKINILKLLETKYDKRLNRATAKLVRDIHEDLKDISHEMEVFSHILERSQDTVLGLVNVERSKEANDATRVMNRLSQIAIVFLPVQAMAGFFGMNVQVPFQHEAGTLPFWAIICTSITLGFTAFSLRKFILLKQFTKGNGKSASGVL